MPQSRLFGSNVPFDSNAQTRQGSKCLRAGLTDVAWAASHTRTYLGAQYDRFDRQRGKKKVVIATGQTILAITYHIPKEGTTSRGLGQDLFDRRPAARVQDRLIARLEVLGVRVGLEPTPRVT